MARHVADGAGRDDEHDAVGRRARRVDRPLDDKAPADRGELLRSAEAATLTARDDDRPDAVRHG